MSGVLQASGLGKQYRRAWALRDCTLAIPEGRVTGLVGPNGAGKTTLLRLAGGLLAPTRGTISVLGERPAAGPAQLARVGFVAQDTPRYARMTVARHLRLRRWLAPRLAPPPALRGPAPPPRPPPRNPGGHPENPHPQADHPADPHARADPRPGLDRPAGQPGGTGDRLHEPGPR